MQGIRKWRRGKGKEEKCNKMDESDNGTNVIIAMITPIMAVLIFHKEELNLRTESSGGAVNGRGRWPQTSLLGVLVPGLPGQQAAHLDKGLLTLA